MNWLSVEGVKPYDGRYPLDPEQDFTTREWGWIKRLSGYMPLTIDPAFEGGDPELYACFAAIAMQRAGKVAKEEVPAVFERLLDAPWPASIRLEGDEPAEGEEADARPPGPSSGERPNTSGLALPQNSATPAASPPPSGAPSSATSPSSRAASGT